LEAALKEYYKLGKLINKGSLYAPVLIQLDISDGLAVVHNNVLLMDV
jgi:hypothetical protein